MNTDKLFFFFQFDFKINLKELKVFLYAIQLYIEIPDYYYDDDDPRMEYYSVRLVIHEQGPKVDWEIVNKTCQNYQIILEFLLLPTGFFQLFKKLQIIKLLNCFIMTLIINLFAHLFFHVINTETEGYMFFNSAEDYYRYLDLL